MCTINGMTFRAPPCILTYSYTQGYDVNSESACPPLHYALVYKSNISLNRFVKLLKYCRICEACNGHLLNLGARSAMHVPGILFSSFSHSVILMLHYVLRCLRISTPRYAYTT